MLPMLVLLLAGILELGTAAGVMQTLDNAAREGARWSAMPVENTETLPSVSAVQQRVQQFAAASGLNLPASDIQVNQAVTGTEGGLATTFSQVDVTYTDNLVTPMLAAVVPSLTLSAHASMRNENN